MFILTDSCTENKVTYNMDFRNPFLLFLTTAETIDIHLKLFGVCYMSVKVSLNTQLKCLFTTQFESSTKYLSSLGGWVLHSGTTIPPAIQVAHCAITYDTLFGQSRQTRAGISSLILKSAV